MCARQKLTSGGSSDTEVNEVAVKPAGGVPGAVTTTTAAACRRNSARKRSGSTTVTGVPSFELPLYPIEQLGIRATATPLL